MIFSESVVGAQFRQQWLMSGAMHISTHLGNACRGRVYPQAACALRQDLTVLKQLGVVPSLLSTGHTHIL